MTIFRLTFTKSVLFAKAVSSLKDMATYGTLNYSKDGLLLIAADTSGLVIAVLELSSFCFSDKVYYRNHSVRIDLHCLHHILSLGNDDDSVTICGCDGPTVARFTFENLRTNKISTYKMKLFPLNDNHLEMDDFQYGYPLAIGIPSDLFRSIVARLAAFGKTISLTVTNSLLKFSASNENVVISRKSGECTIEGDAIKDNVVFLLSLYNMDSIINASQLSYLVWMYPSDASPAMLKCPIGVYGRLMFFFA